MNFFHTFLFLANYFTKKFWNIEKVFKLFLAIYTPRSWNKLFSAILFTTYILEPNWRMQHSSIIAHAFIRQGITVAREVSEQQSGTLCSRTSLLAPQYHGRVLVQTVFIQPVIDKKNNVTLTLSPKSPSSICCSFLLYLPLSLRQLSVCSRLIFAA